MRALIVLGFLIFSLSAFSSADRYLSGKYITNGAYTLTIPDYTGVLLTDSGTATLTNKSISGASNTFSAIPVSAIGNGSVLSGSNTGDVTLGSPANGLSLIGQQLSLAVGSHTATGAITPTDWDTFNGKQDALGFTAVPNTRTVNGHALSADVTVSASDVGLGNVTNDAQVKKSEYTAKGDILAGTGSGTYSALAASGTNGYILTYDSGETNGIKWAAAPSVAPTVTGTRTSPSLITAAGGVSFSGTNYSNMKFIAGDSGPITVTANPQIAAATNVGQKIVLVGRDATNTVTLSDGTGLSLNGSWVGGLDSVLELVWDGAVWVEATRR